jgi:RNA polymerase sigma factor (sigma-70 family)
VGRFPIGHSGHLSLRNLRVNLFMTKLDHGSTSSSLLQLATDRDEDAWKRLLDEYRPWISRICERTGISGSDVDDVIQEILRSVVPSIGSFRSNGRGSFRRWLYTITQRSAIDFHRVNGRKEQATGGTTAQEQLAEFFDDDSLSTRQAFLQSRSVKELNESKSGIGLPLKS